jgi:fucose 4-O-acetylase-like acetyltransferase
MEKTITNRINWIDIAKGIGIFLVVLGHTGIPVKLSYWIYSFHMPLFFFISGMCFDISKYQSFKSILLKKSKTLLLP